MIRIFLIGLIAVAGALWAPVSLNAHELKTALSTVLFNARTGNIEIVHRFNIHDAEHAVREVFGKGADIISSAETQDTFANYVVERFSLLRDNGDPVGLEYLGFEIEGKFFWVYQEAPSFEAPQLIMANNALREIWPDQINTVNIEGRGDIQTLTFSGNTEYLSVDFN
ncbi:DUF6702 family protein [Kordiimonas sp. SCSIO 12610]|uniref:DUF6702 family protein n=1 Tax=Kordiimonas sp. SCSIO 12610 TaxID=2829597 RepID=UPI00210EC26F|nr:DUF6702 family protein [Kordiimonas sp. SCSIO 12610]UTW55840.1 hypothetical protein KFF44_02820 [Kordiimonas sp. SCSIO 12610]